MNKLLLSLLAATALAGAVPAAAGAATLNARIDAQGAHLYLAQYNGPTWISINQRQANLDARIDEGIRNHRISAAEAASLRAQFRDIANLEAHYRYTGGGLDPRERADLNARFDNLSNRINQANATPVFVSINQRQANLDARIDDGIRNHRISPAEAASLRAQFRDIANLEAHYRYTGGGLDDHERADLNARFDSLSNRINQANATPVVVPGWVMISNRLANIDARIDQGVHSGALTPVEAARLRAEFRDLVQVETRYRASGGGLDPAERADLDARFNRLSAQVFVQKHDMQVRH